MTWHGVIWTIVLLCLHRRPVPIWGQQQKPGDPCPGADLGQRSVVQGGGDRSADSRRPHIGAAHHAGAAYAAQREQAASGPAAADAVTASLQLPWPPHQKGPRGQTGPGVHGAGHRPRELLSVLRQDEASRTEQWQDPVSGSLGDVQRPRQTGVRMTSCWEICDRHLLTIKRGRLLFAGLLFSLKDIPKFLSFGQLGMCFHFLKMEHFNQWQKKIRDWSHAVWFLLEEHFTWKWKAKQWEAVFRSETAALKWRRGAPPLRPRILDFLHTERWRIPNLSYLHICIKKRKCHSLKKRILHWQQGTKWTCVRSKKKNSVFDCRCAHSSVYISQFKLIVKILNIYKYIFLSDRTDWSVCLVLGESPTSLFDQTISLIVSVKENLPLKVSFYLYHNWFRCFCVHLL